MKVEKHAHKLRRHTYTSGNAIYFCALPDCSFKIAPALALGKRCVCWRCGNDFIMNEYSIRLAKPHCQDCHQPKGSSVISTNDANREPMMPPILVTDPLSAMRERLSGLTNKDDGEDI